MQTIPLQAVPSQIVTTFLGDQQCSIKIYQKFYGLFIDLSVIGGFLQTEVVRHIVTGQICWNLNLIVRYGYLGFTGDLAFIDTQGSDNPIFTGLGSRFQLLYLAPNEVIAVQMAQAEAVLAFALLS
jgi:hypothetical protein